MEDTSKQVVEDVLSQFKVEPVEHPNGGLLKEFVFVNDKTNPAVRNLFHMFHRAAFTNQLGFMVAKHEPTGDITTLIVGVDQTGDTLQMWPLARVLTEEEQTNYKVPDGNGSYV